MSLRTFHVYLAADVEPVEVKAEVTSSDTSGCLAFITERKPVAVFAPGKWLGFVEVFK